MAFRGNHKFQIDMQCLDRHFAQKGHMNVKLKCGPEYGNPDFGKRVKRYREEYRNYLYGLHTTLSTGQVEELKRRNFVTCNNALDDKTVALEPLVRPLKKFLRLNGDARNILQPDANWTGFSPEEKRSLISSYRRVLRFQQEGKGYSKNMKKLLKLVGLDLDNVSGSVDLDNVSQPPAMGIAGSASSNDAASSEQNIDQMPSLPIEDTTESTSINDQESSRVLQPPVLTFQGNTGSASSNDLAPFVENAGIGAVSQNSSLSFSGSAQSASSNDPASSSDNDDRSCSGDYENGNREINRSRLFLGGASMNCGCCAALGNICYAPKNQNQRHKCIRCGQFVHLVFCSSSDKDDDIIYCHICSGEYRSRLRRMKKNELIREAKRRELQLTGEEKITDLKMLLSPS